MSIFIYNLSKSVA